MPDPDATSRRSGTRDDGLCLHDPSQKRGTIYIGVTNSLARRIPEHKDGVGSKFTAKYGVRRLVWYEEHFDISDAIQREKSLKRWLRQWKIDLIEKENPHWNELFVGWGWD